MVKAVRRLLWQSAICLLAIGSSALGQPAQSKAGPSLFNPIFRDHAVLQRGRPIVIWGVAKPQARVSVALGEASVSVRANAAGQWRATLRAREAGGPYRLSARSDGHIENLDDVLVGDVYLCSGQSNMVMPLETISSAFEETARPADPQLRIVTIPRASAPAPLSVLSAPVQWEVAGPETAPKFSAACLLMGRNLRKDLNVPIGLIGSYWGGSPIEDWMSQSTIETIGGYHEKLELVRTYARNPVAGWAAFEPSIESWWQAHKPHDTAAWSRPEFDDSNWRVVHLSPNWENSGAVELAQFDGTLWLRQQLVLTAEQSAAPARLSLGIANRIATTFVNGVRVGSEDGDVGQVYDIPLNTLRAGANEIAVRLTTHIVGTGGFVGGPGGFKAAPAAHFLALGDALVPLSSEWRYTVLLPYAEMQGFPRAPWTGSQGLGTLYNAMIAPLGPYGIRAVAWYQGERNANNSPDNYAQLLPAMMADWRAQFGADLPFLIVQLANFRGHKALPEKSRWAELREAQRRTVDKDSNSALTVTIDIGDPYDVHPANKREVGRRVALQARRLIYEEKIESQSPLPAAVAMANGEVVIEFTHAGDGLVVYGASRPIGFELCDSGGACRFVDAVVQGKSVRLSVPAGMTPTHVRYAWADSPIVNLFGSTNLPVVPFEEVIRK